jgi:hypothetical protein
MLEQEALGAGALVGELRRHLPPALAFRSDEGVLGRKSAVEDDFVEMLAWPVRSGDRAIADARQRQVDQKLEGEPSPWVPAAATAIM